MRIYFSVMTIMLLFATVAYGQVDSTKVSVEVKIESSSDRTTEKEVYKRPVRVKTSWFSGFDLGFANFSDHTDYNSAEAQAFAPGSNTEWFDLKNGKSINVNIWVFQQKINLIHTHLNLKYALGLELNNYRYTNPIRFNKNQPYVSWNNTADRTYRKNKLAADYVNLPIMLNVNFGNPSNRFASNEKHSGCGVKVDKGKEWGFSAGISIAYLYSARNKTITSDEGKEKLKNNFNLNPWKLAYVGELNLGYFSIYGSYAFKSMFKNGLDMTPYTIGIRL